jgi:hypothetical protein
MRELGQDKAGSVAELNGILQHLEAALTDIDRLRLMVIGAQLSQVIEEIKALIEA